MIGQIGNFGRKVDIGRKMNDLDGALDPWSCLYIAIILIVKYYLSFKKSRRNTTLKSRL